MQIKVERHVLSTQAREPRQTGFYQEKEHVKFCSCFQYRIYTSLADKKIRAGEGERGIEEGSSYKVKSMQTGYSRHQTHMRFFTFCHYTFKLPLNYFKRKEIETDKV